MKYRICLLVALLLGSLARADVAPQTIRDLYAKVSPSLVAVQFTWESEAGRRELVGAGVVISEDGLVMAPIALTDLRIPDAQMKEFKIIIPRNDADDEEIDAVFVGRDERNNLTFVKPKEARKFPAIKFEDVPLGIGDPIISIGLLPKAAGYRTYFLESAVSAMLRGEFRQVLCANGLTTPGSPVFNAKGQAVGFVNVFFVDPAVLLNNPESRSALGTVASPPRVFIPSKDFLSSLSDLPTPGEPLKMPWTGIAQLTGLKKEVADFYGLTNQPAVQIGDIVPGTPAEKAGLKQGQIIVKMNGQPLERGDEPDELPQILRRHIFRMKVGSVVTFTVLTKKDQPTKEVKVTLEEQPPRSTIAKRYYAEDLGFSVREMVFMDAYSRKLPQDTKGVIVSFTKQQSAAASAKLALGDLITEFNREPVKDLEDFKTKYQAFRKEKPNEAVVLVVTREGRSDTVRIEPPQ
jgi:S1-C subfamily serine protease